MMPPIRTATVLVTIALMFGIGVVVALLWLPETAPRLEHDPSVDRSVEELRASIDVLIREVRDLRGPIEQQRLIAIPSESAGQRVQADQPEEGLVKQLDALVSALQARTSATDSEPLSAIAKHPPAQGSSTLFRGVGDPDFEGFDWNAPEKRLEERHLFWSVRELLREYGPPTEITNEKGLRLVYRSEDENLRVTFAIDSGIVVSVRLGN
jgi:hypothetical protein